MNSKKNTSMTLIIFVLIALSNNYSFASCVNSSSIVLLPFKTKNLRQEEYEDNFYEDSFSDDDGGNQYFSKISYNISNFLNEWFYNGIYTVLTSSDKTINCYLSLESSDFNIGKCNMNKVSSLPSLINGNYYKPSKSDSFENKGSQIGNDNFHFVSDLSYKNKVNQKLDFFLDKKDETYCGNLGLNIAINKDSTNIIEQLKRNNQIPKYVWTLFYQTQQDGILVLGIEPHFYDERNMYMSQYQTIYSIPNKDQKKTSWSFYANEIFMNGKQKISLKENKVELFIDHGLIIGTDEYKAKIDQLFFNELIEQEKCYRRVLEFFDKEIENKEEYYVYYCNKDKVIGSNKYSIAKDMPFNQFPELYFYLKNENMTFKLDKYDLFENRDSNSFFLIIFKKSDNTNKVWKLGEPFLYKNKFIFDQEQKTIGFYNPFLKRIPNEEYIHRREEERKKHGIMFYIFSSLAIIFLIFLAFYFGKKLNERRKIRANELVDEDFEYSTDKKINFSKKIIDGINGGLNSKALMIQSIGNHHLEMKTKF